MAIKGKKKSGSRGSQARRRPAAAPRPVAGTTRHRTPWYNTATGRVVAAVLVVALLAGIGTLIAINRSNANKEKQRLERLEDYANQMRAIVQSAATPAGEMSAIIPTATSDQLETLGEDAEGWANDIEAAATKATTITPPEQITTTHPLFQQALQIYASSARLLLDAADAEGKARADLITRATEIRSNAEGIWISAVAQLDEQLAELGGDPSGLQSPATAGAAAAAATTPSEDGASGNDNGGNDNGGNDNGGGGSGGGSGGGGSGGGGGNDKDK